MDLPEIKYNPVNYVETASGNKVCRQAYLPASNNIVLQGKVIVQKEAILRADLANIKVGRFSILSEGCLLRPAFKKFSKAVAFFPLYIGDYTYVGENSIVQAGSIGSFVYIGKNVVIGRRCILKDCCMIEDDAIVPPDAVVPSFARYGGSPATVVDDLPECTQELMIDFCKTFYERFKSDPTAPLAPVPVPKI